MIKQIKKTTLSPDDVVIKWSWLDAKELRPDMSVSKIKEIFDNISKGLEQNSIRIGWEIMETLIQMEEE